MGTVSKNYTETYNAGGGVSNSTWTLSATFSNASSNDSGDFTLTPTATGKYTAGNSRNKAKFEALFNFYYGNNPCGPTEFIKSLSSWSAGTAVSIPRGSTGINTAMVFSSANKSSKTATVNVKLCVILAETYASDNFRGRLQYNPSSPASWDTITLTLNAKPTGTAKINSTTPYSSGVVNIDCTGLGDAFGADCSSATVTLNGESTTVSSIGTNQWSSTVAVPVTAHGKFKPTLTITNSRNNTGTITGSEINITKPTVVFSCERADNTGKPADEGTDYAVLTSTFTWLDALSNLAAPTVSVSDIEGTSQQTTTTWYASRANDGTLSNPISSWSSVTRGSTIYGLVSGSFDLSKSYNVTMTPADGIGAGTANTQTLDMAFYTLDFLAGGHGIAFGRPCLEEGFWCDMPVYLALDCNGTASSDATSGEDMDLFNNIRALGWYSDVIV